MMRAKRNAYIYTRRSKPARRKSRWPYATRLLLIRLRGVSFMATNREVRRFDRWAVSRGYESRSAAMRAVMIEKGRMRSSTAKRRYRRTKIDSRTAG